jgi:xylose isomerase
MSVSRRATDTRLRTSVATHSERGTLVRNYDAAGDAMQGAHATPEAAFEFFTQRGVGFRCFHDRGITLEGEPLAETHQRLDEIGVRAKKLQENGGRKLLIRLDRAPLSDTTPAARPHSE